MIQNAFLTVLGLESMTDATPDEKSGMDGCAAKDRVKR